MAAVAAVYDGHMPECVFLLTFHAGPVEASICVLELCVYLGRWVTLRSPSTS